MNPKPFTSPLRMAPVLSVILLVLLAGCSLHKAKTAFDEGNFEVALQTYREILRKDPTNVQARIGYRRAATRAAEKHLADAREAERRGQEDVVEKEVREAYRLDPSNALAQDWIARLELKRLKRESEAQAEDSLEDKRTKGEAKTVILLNPRSLEGMDLNFTRKTSLKDILGAISRNSGVSVLFHSSYQDASVAADLRGLSFQRILDTLMIQSDLFYKVIDSNTIMVFKNTPRTVNSSRTSSSRPSISPMPTWTTCAPSSRPSCPSCGSSWTSASTPSPSRPSPPTLPSPSAS